VDNVWLVSALWVGLALAAALISIWVGISVALIEIMVGALAGNTVGLSIAPWVNYLAGFGAIPDLPCRRRNRRAGHSQEFLVDVATHVVYGHPVPTIIDFIQKHGIDHLVIGFMGHSAIYNRIIGGKSDKLVRLAPCSVTVVK
jgi:hypothetical protein